MKDFDEKSNSYIALVNNEWIVGPRKHHSKFPKLTWLDLQEVTRDLMIMLSLVMGSPQGTIL